MTDHMVDTIPERDDEAALTSDKLRGGFYACPECGKTIGDEHLCDECGIIGVSNDNRPVAPIKDVAAAFHRFTEEMKEQIESWDDLNAAQKSGIKTALDEKLGEAFPAVADRGDG